MAHDDFDKLRLEEFKKRIGFSELEAATGPEGVVAPWDGLPGQLASVLKQLRLRSWGAGAVESGLADGRWTWAATKDQTALSVTVFVFGTGHAQAHAKLLSRASETTLLTIPYELGPSGLGDLSIRSFKPPSQVVMWVYCNVFVEVDNDRSGLVVEPVTRAIQRFMEAHRVPDVASHLPAVAVKVSTEKIHVGDVFQVSINLGKRTPSLSLMTDFGVSLDDRLERLSREPLTATYKAKLSGQTRIEIPVADRKTLLSPALSVTLNILPAR